MDNFYTNLEIFNANKLIFLAQYLRGVNFFGLSGVINPGEEENDSINHEMND